jgi:sugar phosphate permease
MVADPSLGLTKADIGLLASAFPAAYGLSKFAGGLGSAAFSPRLMLAGCVALTAALNLAFGAVPPSLTAWTAIWLANGALQGIGAPACTMMLSRWYGASERGTYWGLWQCLSSNVGGFVAPLLVGSVAAAAGWRAGFFFPGVWGVAVGAALVWALADSPGKAGFEGLGGESGSAAKEAAASSAAAGNAPAPTAAASISKREALSRSMSEVARHPGTWLLALAYFFVYVVRQGATSWLVFYLLEEKGVADAAQAAARVSGLELGGLLGGTLAGIASDRAIRGAKARRSNRRQQEARQTEQQLEGQQRQRGGDKQQQKEEGLVGKRVRVTMAYCAATILVLLALRALPATAPAPVLWLTIAALGFTIYGPQMLVGLCGAELVAPSSVGASQGILGLISYMGAANAGVPLAALQRAFGWDGYFAAMAGASAVAVLLLAPLANARSRAQREEQEDEERDGGKAAAAGR